jgi:TRAP-type C4-dicarboxylate transport system substrate-binding protein
MSWKNFLSSLLVSSALLTTSLTGARADTFDVSIATGHSLNFAWVKQLHETFIPATNKALEGSGHTITWTENFGGTVSAVGREIDTVGEGLAEIGLGLIIFRAQAQPEQSVGFNAPFSTTEAVKVGETMKRLQQTVPALTQSWNGSGVEYLGGEFTYDNYQLFTTFPVEKLEDLKGRKIAAAGSAGNWFKGTGAIVVAADLTSYYGSLKDKVVDGVVTFGIAAPAAKLHEVATYMVKVNFGPQYAGGIIANRKWFQDLPEPVRQALKKGADSFSAAYFTELATRTDAAYKTMGDKGLKIVDFPEAEREKWVRAMPNIGKDWAANLDGKGLPGTNLLSTYMKGLRDVGQKPLRNWDME